MLALLAGPGCKEQKPVEWKQFASESGNFSILLPGTPKQSIDTKQTTEFHKFWIEADTETSYLVLYNDYSLKVDLRDPEALFDRIQNSVVDKTARLISHKSLELQGYPVREFEYVEVAEPDDSKKVRLILVGRRLYQILAIFPSNDPHSEVRERFFDSFLIGKN